MNRKEFILGSLLLPLVPRLEALPGVPAVSERKAMWKAKIPSSGELLGRVGLGTYKNFDVGNDEGKRQNLVRILNAFANAGGTLVDSSPMYGSSESVLGAAASTADLVERLFVATKVWTQGQQEGERQMRDSMRKLNRKKLELMQIHNLVDWKSHLRTIAKWKAEGIFKYVGITHYSVGAFAELEQVLKAHKFDFLQIPYSIAETEAERRLIPLAFDLGVAVVANEPFDKGRLFGRVRGKAIPTWAQEIGITSWAEYFLKFILASDQIQFVIPATSKLEHLADNLRGGSGIVPNREQRSKMRNDWLA
ncbi:MAG: aldo/keto reductase [Leptospirales bacterium]|nr:aldo/keto reductase [Leptospirales bacterium]